jgi:hypothetical protein
MTTPTVSVKQADCMAHGYHAPPPDYLELHHVVPRDWQQAWRPPDARNVEVWLPITVPLCRTGHGNVHYVLERIMRSYARVGDLAEAITAAVAEVHADGLSVGRVELAVARRGPQTWVEVGGSLDLLIQGGHFGVI